MALKMELWIPETYLRGINKGPGTLELSIIRSADASTMGKTIIMKPASDTMFQVKELLPVSAEELSKLLSGTDIRIHMNAVGGNAPFSLLEEGPYRSVVRARKYENQPQMAMDYYQEILANQDFYRIKEVINAPVNEQWKVSPSFYSGACFLRGQMFRIFLRIPEAEAAFEAGYEGFAENDKWAYCFEWVETLLLYLTYPNGTPAQRGKGMERAIEILNRTTALVKGMKYEKYHLMGASCLRAFMLCYLGEEDQALAEFDEFDFSPIPQKEYNENELNFFFRFVAYGFWAAIEMKNAALLRNLSSIISIGFPDMLLEPSPMRCFRRAFGNADEKGRSQLNIATNNLMIQAHLYAPEMPNLRQFVIHMNNKDDAAIDGFIGYVE